jgi:hypothetical protein
MEDGMAVSGMARSVSRAFFSFTNWMTIVPKRNLQMLDLDPCTVSSVASMGCWMVGYLMLFIKKRNIAIHVLTVKSSSC